MHSDEEGVQWCREQLVDLYSRHNPSKLESIDRFLIKYEGRERDLVQAVRNKYE